MKYKIQISDEIMSRFSMPKFKMFTGDFEYRYPKKGEWFLRGKILMKTDQDYHREKQIVLVLKDDVRAIHKFAFDKWIKDNDIKIGDMVTVTRIPTYDEIEGIPGYTYDKDRYEYVNKFIERKIKSLSHVRVSTDHGILPHYILKKVSKYIDAGVTQAYCNMLQVDAPERIGLYINHAVGHKEFISYIWRDDNSKEILADHTCCFSPKLGHCTHVRFKQEVQE